MRADVAETGRRHQARYFYDAFNRRIAKEVDGDQTVFGWDGDRLAFETSAANSTHYLYEADTFVPLAQYRGAVVAGIETPAWHPDDRYVPENDPLMQPPAARGSVAVYYYQCDQIGTPQYLSDTSGDIAVEMSYKAWGEAREVISDAAKAAGITNPLRFQGQYFDAETGVHYNRHRYYDPTLGRFVSKDPIRLLGGLNLYQYSTNAVQWIDPLGLAPKTPSAFALPDGANATSAEMAASVGGPTGGGRSGASGCRQQLLDTDFKQNGGLYRCWRCGQTSTNPADMHLGHKNVPVSKGGNLSPENTALEGAACNLSAGNRGAPSSGMSCVERGGCGAPYGR